MNIKLLKKIRKRYSWRWDKRSNIWKVSDHTNRSLNYYNSTSIFMQNIINSYKPFLNYLSRRQKRDDRLSYYIEQKKLALKFK